MSARTAPRAAVRTRAALLPIIWTLGAAAMAAPLVLAPPAAAQAVQGSWSTADGGAVVLRADGNFDLSLDDEGTKEAIFATGKARVDSRTDEQTVVILRSATGDRTYRLTIARNGSAVLETTGGRRVATLRKD